MRRAIIHTEVTCEDKSACAGMSTALFEGADIVVVTERLIKDGWDTSNATDVCPWCVLARKLQR